MQHLSLYFLLFFYFNVAATNISTSHDNNLVVGVWNVNLIDFSDCKNTNDDLSLDMRFSNCFEHDDEDVCIQMLMDFKPNGSLIQSFRVLSKGKLIDDTKEYSHYTIAENKITICSKDSGHCETSDIAIEDGQLVLSGRDVGNRCNLILKSTK